MLAPRRTPAPYTLVVLAGVLIIKELLFRHVSRVGESIGSTAVKSDAWHHRSDALTSAFAFVGISIALLGGPGWEAADGWAALAAASVILYGGWRQLRPAIFELADVRPDGGMEIEIRAIAACVPGVIGLDKCRLCGKGICYRTRWKTGFSTPCRRSQKFSCTWNPRRNFRSRTGIRPHGIALKSNEVIKK